MSNNFTIKIMSFNIVTETLCLNDNSEIIISIIKIVNLDIKKYVKLSNHLCFDCWM